MIIIQAASAVLDFKPKIMYPLHYRDKPDMSDTVAFKKLVDTKSYKIDILIKKKYTI